MTGFLTSGRRTRFQPTADASRTVRVRQNSDDGAAPSLDPAIVRQQADDATELLGSQAYARAIEFLANEAQEKFENSPSGPRGTEDRDTAHAMLRALSDIHARLLAMVDDAKFSAANEADEKDDGE